MTYAALLLSYKGRIDRRTFWRGMLAAVVTLIIVAFGVGRLFEFAVAMSAPAPAIPGLVSWFGVLVGLLGAYMQLAVMAKRFHDRDKSGWWVLVGFIPLLGLLWYIVELGSLGGTRGLNRFGPPSATGSPRA